MKALGRRSIASFVGAVLTGTWWLIALGFLLIACLLVASFFIPQANDHFTMDLPVTVELQSPLHPLDTTSGIVAQIRKVRGDLRFPVQRGAFFSANLALLLILSGFGLWIVNQLRGVFRSLSAGTPFVSENARRIRWVGLTVIFSELFRSVMVYLWSYYASKHFTANGLSFVATPDLNFMTLFCGLAILVIAEVFREGTRLREDQSLTI